MFVGDCVESSGFGFAIDRLPIKDEFVLEGFGLSMLVLYGMVGDQF